MVQKNYRATNGIELESFVNEIIKSEEYRTSKSILIQLYFEMWDERKVGKYVEMLKLRLPKADIVGMTNVNRELYSVLHSVDVDDPLKKVKERIADIPIKPDIKGRTAMECMARTMSGMAKAAVAANIVMLDMNVLYFNESETRILAFETTNEECEIFLGGRLSNALREIPYVKGVLLLAAGEFLSVEDFGAMALAQAGDIPMFGATASIQWSEVHGDGEMVPGFVFHEGRFIKNGFVAVVLCGENLHIRTGYNFGWTPIGKAMKITDIEGESLVHTIDDKPATEPYRKYLGLQYHQLITENVCEFPFSIERGDRCYARIGMQTDNPDDLLFSAPVYEGDELRLSFGSPANILREAFEDSEELADFEPQAIILSACMNRSIFLKKDVQQELDFYRRFNENLLIMHGNSEILFDSEGGGELNSALVSVGMREGEPTGRLVPSSVINSAECPSQREIVPLAQRMITFLEATTSELVDAVKEAKRANQAKTDFLSNISHEIRTPVNAVLGLDEMILREAKDENIRNYATDIQNSGRNLLSLINDILDSSRIESGKMEIIPVEYELSSMLNDLVNMTQVRAKEKDLELKVEVDENIPHVLFGDDTRIRQCALNILTNAVKYTRKGTVTLKVFAEKTDDDNIGLTFTISDTGIGIKEEDMEKLFSRFERIEENRNRTIEGTGLGMSIVQNLLSMMDSKLYVDSVYGEGSTFSFTVIQGVRNPEPIGDFTKMYRRSMEAANTYRESFHAPDARILVVDDTRMNLTVIRGLLKDTKIGIDTAESGEEALVMVQSKHYDMIFLDQRMPEMDGVETFRRMKHIFDSPNKDTPVIMLTANAIAGAREYFLSEGFNDYLTKPVDGSKLEAMLLKFLPADLIEEVSGDETPASDVSTSYESEFIKALRDVSGVSVEDGLTNCMNEELLSETVKDFVASAKKNYDEIGGYLEVSDIENYTIRVHALKSSARIIGANDISERAKYLESCGDNNDIDEINKLTPGLLSDYKALAEGLEVALKAGGYAQENTDTDETADDIKGTIESEELKQGLSAVRELIEAFDFDGASGIVEMLMAMEMSAYEKKLVSRVSDAIRRLERDELLEML